MSREDRMSWVSGYHGQDSMRDKAKRMLGHEQATESKRHIPESFSSPGHTKMRKFAEGGHAEGGEAKRGGHRKHHADGGKAECGGGAMKHGGHHHHRKHHAEGGETKMAHGGHSRHHKLSHDQSDMHIPTYRKSPKLNVETFHEAESLRHGGKAKKHHYAEGGKAEGGEMKRGGHHKRHYDMGGAAQAPFAQAFQAQPNIGEAMQNQMRPPVMKRGGKAHHKHHAEGGEAKRGGHKHHYARGGHTDNEGIVMVGERPSHKAHHVNYESVMKGEHARSKPSSRHESKAGLDDKNRGQMFRKGGHAEGGEMKRGGHGHHKHHSRHHEEGGEIRRAAGGVAKIRHCQATAAGKPMGAKRVIRNNLF